MGRGWNFVDISIAFDEVWHARLIYKLIYLMIPIYLKVL